MLDRVGQQLGNYRLIQLLGQGNFASVYLGKHIHLNTHAALKVLHERLAGNEAEDFLTEARTIASLRHPHIIQVLDFGVAHVTADHVEDGNYHNTLYTELNTDLPTFPPPPVEP